MTTITGTVKGFKNMFEKIMCGRKYPLFPTVILGIKEEIISVNAMDPTKAVGTAQEYTEFNIEGGTDIPIDTVSIYDAINLFDDNEQIKFIYEDNKIILTTNSLNKKDTITIPSLTIDDIIDKSQIKFTEDTIIINDNEMKFNAHVTVNSSHIKNQIKKGSFVNDLYHEYIINIDNNKLTLMVGDPTNYEISSSTEIEVDGSGQCKSIYSHGYDDIFKSLSGDVVIHINNNKPMLIVQTTDNYSVKFLIAPLLKE